MQVWDLSQKPCELNLERAIQISVQVETALWRNANPHWDPVVASFLKYFKSRILAIAGGSPPAPPAAPRGSGLSARRLSKISRESMKQNI